MSVKREHFQRFDIINTSINYDIGGTQENPFRIEKKRNIFVFGKNSLICI